MWNNSIPASRPSRTIHLLFSGHHWLTTIRSVLRADTSLRKKENKRLHGKSWAAEYNKCICQSFKFKANGWFKKVTVTLRQETFLTRIFGTFSLPRLYSRLTIRSVCMLFQRWRSHDSLVGAHLCGWYVILDDASSVMHLTYPLISSSLTYVMRWKQISFFSSTQIGLICSPCSIEESINSLGKGTSLAETWTTCITL